jgi:hypothetical protein
MGRPLDPECAGRDGRDGSQGTACAEAATRTSRASGRGARAGPAHGLADRGAGGAGDALDPGPGSGPGGRRVLGCGQGTDRRRRAGGRRDRGGRRLRCARSRPCAGIAERGSGDLRSGHRGRCSSRRFRPLPAGRGHGLGQDRGLSGGGGRRPEGRSDGADPDPAARDRPDPGGDRAASSDRFGAAPANGTRASPRRAGGRSGRRWPRGAATSWSGPARPCSCRSPSCG